MLPLMSKITPSEIGASSLEKMLDLLLLPPVEDFEIVLLQTGHQRFIGSVMVTGTSTRSTSTFMGRVCVSSVGLTSGAALAPGNEIDCACGDGGVTSGVTCTSWWIAKCGRGNQQPKENTSKPSARTRPMVGVLDLRALDRPIPTCNGHGWGQPRRDDPPMSQCGP